ILSGIVLSLWGLVSCIYLPPQRLADTSVPYSLAAWAVLEWTGRKIMGLVVLAATCGAVNGLLAAVARMIVAMAFRGLLPSFFGVSNRRASVPFIFLVLSIAAMLASGMAGEPDLEVYTRGSTYFWLLNYGAVHLSVLILRKRNGLRSQSCAVPGHPVIPLIGLLATYLGVFGLVCFDAEPALLLKFMAVVLAAALLLGMVWVSIRSRKSSIIT
ncbi:MAG: amino acid permease, partial [candidate division Zixibacteria bacterium]|nr:amino acid permease [candidate division Zixibacteria bacterium]